MDPSRIALRAIGSRRQRPQALRAEPPRVARVIALALARASMNVAIGYHRSGRAARRVTADLAALGA